MSALIFPGQGSQLVGMGSEFYNKFERVKNIFKTLNYEIKKTDRVFLAGLTKKNLPRKNFRHLSKSEVNILMRL